MCQLFPSQHLVNSVACVLAQLRESEQFDKHGISRHRMHLLFQVTQIEHKPSCILEFNAVCKYPHSRMHWAEIIGVSEHIHQSFTQSVKFGIVIGGESVRTRSKGGIDVKAQTLNQHIIVFPNVFLLWHPECIARLGFARCYPGNFEHINPKIGNIQLHGVALAKHQQSAIGQSAVSSNACLFAKIFIWQLVIRKIWIDIGNPVPIGHQRVRVQQIDRCAFDSLLAFSAECLVAEHSIDFNF